MLNIHIVTVFKWAKSGKLPKPLKLGKTVTAWRAQDLIEFLDSKAGEVGDA